MPQMFSAVVPCTSSTMSSLTNFASLARLKLRSAYQGGSRDNLSLHRWVLLKNSLVCDAHTDSNPSTAAPVSTTTDADTDSDFDGEEVDSLEDGMFAYLFPDPGDALGDACDEQGSEAQWFDSVWESLADSDDDVDGAYYSPTFASADSNTNNDPANLPAGLAASSSSYSDDFATLDSSATSPYSVSYPTVHPPLVLPFQLDSSPCFCSSPDSYSLCPSHEIDDADESVPDAIEDVSDDESDSIHTPFSRSRSSLSLVDPASIPLPHEGQEPHIFSASNDSFPYNPDPLPYSDYNSEHTSPVYGPYQTC